MAVLKLSLINSDRRSISMSIPFIIVSVLIVAATPVGSNVAIFAQMEDMDYTQAVKDICLSTLLCIVTIPLVVSAAGVLF